MRGLSCHIACRLSINMSSVLFVHRQAVASNHLWMGFWSITKKYLGVKLETNDSYLRGYTVYSVYNYNTTYFLLSVRLSSSFSLGEFSRMSPPAYDWCYEQPGGLELRKYCYNQK